jgi:hypothetical protein
MLAEAAEMRIDLSADDSNFKVKYGGRPFSSGAARRKKQHRDQVQFPESVSATGQTGAVMPIRCRGQRRWTIQAGVAL